CVYKKVQLVSLDSQIKKKNLLRTMNLSERFLWLIFRPFLALALLLFSAMAALPVGVFLLFALITIVMSVVGFVFFEGMLHISNSTMWGFFSSYFKLILILLFSVSAVYWRNDSAVSPVFCCWLFQASVAVVHETPQRHLCTP
uniref:Uncharacterized protein n=1 Tax=Xiphophorus couchianus TaxID=32473 RepID=A0A3B5LNQ9_9TELE